MDLDVAKFLRTERKPGSVDVHPHADAIILTYDLDVQILGVKENPLHGEKKSMKKIIDLPMINSRTDCLLLAREIVNQCDLIHHSRIPEVEQIIYYLKKRRLQGGGIKADLEKNGDANKHEEAYYNNLSDYIDLLYEGMQEKIRGALLIQVLARDPENLEALSKNETLISALGRVLREDWKRSISLSTHLVFTFFCFSIYSSFHYIILKCKVGSICMDIIDFELRRYDKWKAQLEGNEVPSDNPIVKKSCPNSASMSEIPRSRIPEPVRPKSGHFGDLNIKAAVDGNKSTPDGNKTLEGSVYDELTMSMESLDDKKLSPEQKLKRFRTLVKKQEHLLRVAYYLLLNIAEDETVEEKMTKRNIVGLLIKALERNNDDLLILVTFLKKLSIMQCNKDLMGNYNIIDKLPKMLESRSADLVHLTLKLLFNLSFDNKLRNKMIRCGFVPKVINFMGDTRHQEVVLKVLYHMSYDVDSKQDFVESICLIVDMLLMSVGNEGDQIMIALCINLAVHPEISHKMVKENRLQSLITRAFTFEDRMLMKMIQNISNNLSVSPTFIEFVGDIAKAVVESKNLDFVTECVGILSNLHLKDLDWAEIFKHFGMINWIKNIISINNTDPELVLQVIVFLGTAGADENCGKLFCDTGIIVALIDLLKTHQEDDEIVLQIVYVFYVTLWHESNIDYLLTKTQVPAYLIDLLQDNNKNIRKICNMCLNIISEHNSAWADRVRIEKFRHHNAQWLQMVDSQQLEPEEEEEEDELPPYLNTEYLSQAVVRPVTAVKNLDDMDLLDEKEVDDNYFLNSTEDLDIIEDYDMEDL